MNKVRFISMLAVSLFIFSVGIASASEVGFRVFNKEGKELKGVEEQVTGTGGAQTFVIGKEPITCEGARLNETIEFLPDSPKMIHVDLPKECKRPPNVKFTASCKGTDFASGEVTEECALESAELSCKIVEPEQKHAEGLAYTNEKTGTILTKASIKGIKFKATTGCILLGIEAEGKNAEYKGENKQKANGEGNTLEVK